MLTFASDFANSTLQNSFLVIVDQQKGRFIRIFAANPRTYLKYCQMLNFHKNTKKKRSFFAFWV